MSHPALLRLEPEGVERAAARWHADAGSLRVVGRSANVVFEFTRARERLFLRLTHEDVFPRDEHAAAVDYLGHLFRGGAPVCRPVESRSGVHVESIQQGDDCFLANVVEAVPGRSLAGADCSPDAVHALGAALGRLHAVAESYVPAPGMRFLSWERNWAAARRRLAEGHEVALEEYERVDRWLREVAGRAPDRGITHADVNLTNVFWDGRQVRLIDFDEPMDHFFAADLARPFRDWADRDLSARRALRRRLLAGYRSQRALDDRWEDALGWLMRMKDLEVYGWLVEPGNWTGSRLPGGADRERHLADLRARFRTPLEW